MEYIQKIGISTYDLSRGAVTHDLSTQNAMWKERGTKEHIIKYRNWPSLTMPIADRPDCK